MSKQRLIDANALKDEMRAGCVPIDLGGITGITGDDDSIEDYIDAAPTIDAIPVAWLRDWQDEVGTINEWWPIIERIITVWHEEQEART